MMNIQINPEKLYPEISLFFQQAIQNNRMVHAYLFEGGNQVQKCEFTLWLATLLLYGFDLSSSEQMYQIKRMLNHDHPDVFRIIPDGKTIKVDQIREIKNEFSKSGMESTKKIFIVENAEKMTINAANSLLKFIEEPPGDMTVFLLTDNKEKLLPTVRSRCQYIYFGSLSKKNLQIELENANLSIKMISVLMELESDVYLPVELGQEKWFQEIFVAVEKWVQYLHKKDPLAFVYVQQVLVGLFKEKEQQFLLFDLLLSFYRLAQKEKVKQMHDKKNVVFLTEQMELILKSRRKLISNVSFQNICEQLAWHLIK